MDQDQAAATVAEAVTVKAVGSSRDPELVAMDRVRKECDKLDHASAIRVIRWNLERRLAEMHSDDSSLRSVSLAKMQASALQGQCQAGRDAVLPQSVTHPRSFE